MIFWKFKIVMTEKIWWQKNDKLFNLRKMHVCIIDYTFQETKILISINKKWSKSENCFWFCLSERIVKAFRSGKCERAFAVLPTIPSSSPTCCFPFSFHTLSREEKTPTAPLYISVSLYSLETVTSRSFHLSRTWKLRASRDFHGNRFSFVCWNQSTKVLFIVVACSKSENFPCFHWKSSQIFFYTFFVSIIKSDKIKIIDKAKINSMLFRLWAKPECFRAEIPHFHSRDFAFSVVTRRGLESGAAAEEKQKQCKGEKKGRARRKEGTKLREKWAIISKRQQRWALSRVC